MRNPHAHTRAEWTGPWADDSDLWTDKAIDRLGYTPNMDTLDGIFWMSNSDFLQEFKQVFVCRELTEKTGWFELTI